MNGINRRRLDPNEARTHFQSDKDETKIGQHDGRITSKRKSYKQSSRRARADDAEILETGDLSEDEEEGFDSKLARLRREIGEVKAESERRKSEKKTVSFDAPNNGSNWEKPDPQSDDLDSLSQVLEGLEPSDHQGSNAATRFLKRINAPSSPNQPPTNGTTTSAARQPPSDPSYTLTYAPTYAPTHTLAKVADFDARLTLLETILGAGTIPLATQGKPDTKPILPALNSLQRQISIISNSSESSIDEKNKKVHQLTRDAEKLTEARKSAKAAHDAMQEAMSDTESPASRRHATGANGDAGMESIEDPEQMSKINALYGTLPTIESLSPLLPSLLDRLRSLRSVHADAANASQRLARAESRQEGMAEELKSWREGLEKIEGVVRESEQTMSGNMKAVEGWVRELEERLGSMGR